MRVILFVIAFTGAIALTLMSLATGCGGDAASPAKPKASNSHALPVASPASNPSSSSSANCIDKVPSQLFAAVPLKEDELKVLQREISQKDNGGLLPYLKEIPSNKVKAYKKENCSRKKDRKLAYCKHEPTIPLYNLLELHSHDKFINNEGTALKVLLPLPQKEDIVPNTFEAKLVLAIRKPASKKTDKYDHTESVGFVDLKIWSGKLALPFYLYNLYNPNFGSSHEVNTLYSDELSKAGPKTKKGTYENQMTLNLAELFSQDPKNAPLKPDQVLNQIYRVPRDSDGNLAHRVVVYDSDAQVVSSEPDAPGESNKLNTGIIISYQRYTHNQGCPQSSKPAPITTGTAHQ